MASNNTYLLLLSFHGATSPGMAWLGPVLRASPGCSQGVGWAAFSSEGWSGEEPAPALIDVIGGMLFPCSILMERPDFLLTIAWRPPSHPRSRSEFPDHMAISVGSSQHGCLLLQDQQGSLSLQSAKMEFM